MSDFASVEDLIEEKALLVEDGNHGEYRPLPFEFEDSGVPYIRASDINSGFVDFQEAGKINMVAYARVRKGVGAPGDCILSHKGTVGLVARAPKNAPEFVCSPQTTVWRSLNQERIDGQFLLYALKSRLFQSQLRAIELESDMAAYVSLTQQRLLQIPLPGIVAQRSIAEVLGALDDKIAVCERVAALADALRGREVEAALTGSTTERQLSQMARFVNGRNFTKNAAGVGRPVIRIAELRSGLSPSTVYSEMLPVDDHVAGVGALLFSWSGSLTVRRWALNEGIVNQHIFKVIPRSGVPLWLVGALLERELPRFRAIAADKATTMGHIQRKHLDVLVPVPSDEWIAVHGPRMSSHWDLALAAELETQRLAALRDALLPELMSGRLRVKDAEKQVEEVL